MIDYPPTCEMCGEKSTRWAKMDGRWRAWCSNACRAKALSRALPVNFIRPKVAR